MSTSLPLTAAVSDLIWIQTAFLGDVVLNTGAFDLAASTFPGVRQHVITTGIGARVLEGLDSVASALVFKKRSGSPFSAMRQVAGDLRSRLQDPGRTVIVQPHRSFRSSLLARYLGFPVVTYFETPFGFFASKVARVSRVGVLHEAARSALPLELLGVTREKIVAVRPRLAAKKLDINVIWQKNLAQLKGQGSVKIIGLAPGSQWGTKRWTREGFADLCRKILADPLMAACHLVLLGGADEKGLCDDIHRMVMANENVDTEKNSRLTNLAGLTAIDDLRAVFPHLDLLVGNDSSPVQFASAFNVKTVAIFGATTPAMGFGPLADGSVVLQLDLECRPCSDHGPMKCPLGHFKCMRQLSADRVFDACRRALGI